MAEGFRERARRVRALLLGPSSAFLLVAAPGRESVRQSTQFLDRLEAYGVRLAGVFVNRIRLWPSGDLPAEGGQPSDLDLQTLAAALRASEGASYPSRIAAKAAVDAATGYAAMVRSDARSTRPLRTRTEEQGRFWGCIPEFEGDVHDLAGLARVADRIVGRDREPSGIHER
jgi:anion-transporting  ArsA/GET3 family ATPase